MEWMDRARRFGGFIWVGAGLLFQGVWAIVHTGHQPGPVTLFLMALIAILGVFMIRDPASRWSTVGGWTVAVALALDFAAAVLDRFGALGGPSSGGVSWGSWPAFVDYTAALLGDPVRVWATMAAVSATFIECILAVLLITGRLRRWVGKATAGLFTVYLIAMLLTLGPGEVARYAMPMLIGGALLVSASPVRLRARTGPRNNRSKNPGAAASV